MVLLKLLRNKVVIYITSRYMTYFIQFLVGLMIAGKLGPYYFGLYGFLQLILNYFGNINLGVHHSLNVLLVHSKNDDIMSSNYIANAIFITIGMTLVLGLVYIYITFFPPVAFEKYQVQSYLWCICLIASLQYFNNVNVTVLRIENHLNAISVIQSIEVVFFLISVLLFNKGTLIFSLIASMLLANIVSVCLAYKYDAIPDLSKASFSKKILKNIIFKGIYLFMFNSCFAFITISNRTIISSYYSVETFGKFTFSYQLANALMALSASMSYVIVPKLVDRLSSSDVSIVNATVDAVNNVYVTFTHLLMYIAMPFFALLVVILPQYKDALTAMNLIALAVLMNTNTTAYSSILIARDKEKISAWISLFGLLINIALGLFLVKVLNVEFSYVMMGTMLAYFIVCLLMSYYANRLLKTISFRKIFLGPFPAQLLIPMIIAIILASIKVEWMMFIPLVMFVLLNYGKIRLIYKNYIVRLINKPQIVDLEK